MSDKETGSFTEFRSQTGKANGSGYGNSKFEVDQTGDSDSPKRNRKALGFGVVLLLLAAATGGYFYTRAPEGTVSTVPQEHLASAATAESPAPQAAVTQPTAAPRIKFETSYFAFRKANLNKSTRENLSKTAKVLLENKELKVRVAGYADEIGTKRYNQALSERRARNAADHLIKAGIDKSRISVIGFGENRPAVMGRDEESRRLNRRVEVDVIVSVPSVAAKK